MKTQSIDTDLKTEAVQIAHLRKVTPAKRACLMRSLSQTVLKFSRRTLRKMNPDLSEQALKVLFVRQCYGDDLADRLRIYLNQTIEACGRRIMRCEGIRDYAGRELLWRGMIPNQSINQKPN